MPIAPECRTRSIGLIELVVPGVHRAVAVGSHRCTCSQCWRCWCRTDLSRATPLLPRPAGEQLLHRAVALALVLLLRLGLPLLALLLLLSDCRVGGIRSGSVFVYGSSRGGSAFDSGAVPYAGTFLVLPGFTSTPGLALSKASFKPSKSPMEGDAHVRGRTHGGGALTASSGGGALTASSGGVTSAPYEESATVSASIPNCMIQRESSSRWKGVGLLHVHVFHVQ